MYKSLIKLSEVRVPLAFLAASPSKDKIDRKREIYKADPSKGSITITADDILIDGYIFFLCALESKSEYISCIVSDVPDCYADTSHTFEVREFDELYRGKRSIYHIQNSKYRGYVRIAHSKTIGAKLRAQHGRCYICNRPISFSLAGEDYFPASIDHIVPLSLGGKDVSSNIAIACKRCNQLKGSFFFSKQLKDLILKQIKQEKKLGIEI